MGNCEVWNPIGGSEIVIVSQNLYLFVKIMYDFFDWWGASLLKS